jgi:PAS domain S-box-containing protein
MHYQYIRYSMVLLASATTATIVGLYALRYRRVPGGASFIILMFSGVVWSLANGLEMAGTDLRTKLVWANVQYLSYSLIPSVWLRLSMEYTGRGHVLTRRRLALLSVEPLLTVAFAWSNPLHGWIHRNVYLDTSGSFSVIAKTYGPWYWLHAAYTSVLIAISIFLLVRSARRAPPLYRKQTLMLLIGLMLPLVCNVSYVLGLRPLRFDVAPAVFSVAGLPVAWALFRYRLLDIVPVARDTVVEGMSDGVIVIDARQRIVDLNPAAQHILGHSAALPIGRHAEEVFGAWPEAWQFLNSDGSTHLESAFGSSEAQCSYELHLSPLADQRGRAMGQLLVLHDVTERRRAQAQLLQQQRALATLEEQERLARELHDSIGQVLGYVNMQTQAVRDLLARNQPQEADACLIRLAAVTQDAHADVREYILSLKAAVSLEQGFFPTLAQYLQRFERNYAIHTECDTPGTWSECTPEPAVQVQLLRIIQEALTNVRKHSGAQRVHLVISIQGAQAQISIEDDGRGFDLERIEQGSETGFGLRIMRERAEAVGGSLQVHSTPGQGTRVSAQIPLRSEGLCST